MSLALFFIYSVSFSFYLACVSTSLQNHRSALSFSNLFPVPFLQRQQELQPHRAFQKNRNPVLTDQSAKALAKRLAVFDTVCVCVYMHMSTKTLECDFLLILFELSPFHITFNCTLQHFISTLRFIVQQSTKHFLPK